MTIRTQLKAGRILNVRALASCIPPSSTNHNETLKLRTALKAGGVNLGNHNEALQVRTALKAGGVQPNHNEALQVRTTLKAGGLSATNHNEALRRESDRQPMTAER
jgi:hypothetical protein